MLGAQSAHDAEPKMKPKLPKVLEQLVEVHPCGTEDHVVHVSPLTPQSVTAESVLALEMTNTGLHCGPAFHPLP